ncbi:hypothetical protein BpHYR1_013252 [Brachionus plicatilis]|uniref:Uncharacterized protein n=1 Tax=Brachionus plicatilis TaxID=10195 RepID=A0A3M7S1A6_BRAPC|nr:hypothetical protein BpHYR1_013252 [Brachionus plicatilis]
MSRYSHIKLCFGYLVFKVVGNFWPLVLFVTFWMLEVVGDWTLANNQSPTTSKDQKLEIIPDFFIPVFKRENKYSIGYK